jgi:hypothetical protein
VFCSMRACGRRSENSFDRSSANRGRFGPGRQLQNQPMTYRRTSLILLPLAAAVSAAYADDGGQTAYTTLDTATPHSTLPLFQLPAMRRTPLKRQQAFPSSPRKNSPQNPSPISAVPLVMFRASISHRTRWAQRISLSAGLGPTTP